GGYSIALAVLSAACPGSSQGFISPDLKTDPSVKSGYTITLATAGAAAGPAGCNGAATETDYYGPGAPGTGGTTRNPRVSAAPAGTLFFAVNGVPPVLASTLLATATPIQ